MLIGLIRKTVSELSCRPAEALVVRLDWKCSVQRILRNRREPLARSQNFESDPTPSASLLKEQKDCFESPDKHLA